MTYFEEGRKKKKNLPEDRIFKWIRIVETGKSSSGKTKIYEVQDRFYPERILGMIKWLPSWRRYAFFPEPETFYEEQCLKDIALFLEVETRAKSERKKK
jgi:hypothetical protein